MAPSRIGPQRIGIVTNVQTLDAGQPVVSEFMEPVATTSTVWWDGCSLQVEKVAETQGLTITTSELAKVFGPVDGDQIPAVDGDGNPAPMAVTDLKSDASLICDGRTYVMRADAVLRNDFLGPHHAECLCEHVGA